MLRTRRWIWIGGAALAFGCSAGEEAPPQMAPAPEAAAAPEADPIESAREEIDAAVRQIDPQAPRELTPEEAEQARQAVEAALEDVRRQIEEKAAELGTAAPAPTPQP